MLNDSDGILTRRSELSFMNPTVQRRPSSYLSTTERAGSSNVVGGRGNLRAVDNHAKVVNGSAVIVGLYRCSFAKEGLNQAIRKTSSERYRQVVKRKQYGIACCLCQCRLLVFRHFWKNGETRIM